jgi:hypothetical protein
MKMPILLAEDRTALQLLVQRVTDALKPMEIKSSCNNGQLNPPGEGLDDGEYGDEADEGEDYDDLNDEEIAEILTRMEEMEAASLEELDEDL